MKSFSLWGCFSVCISALILLEFIHGTKAQSSSKEQRILLQLQQQLEYPNTLQSWQKWTDFCFLQPTSSVIVVCSNGRVTELTVIGNKTSPFDSPKPIPLGKFNVSQQTLSQKFSIDSLFTVLTKLTSLKKLSLVSLGIWGTLPSKIDRFKSLEMLNISSNFIYGEIPYEVSSMNSLISLVLANNLINGNVPNLSTLETLQELDLSNNQIGPNFPSLGTTLTSIILRNNSIRSSIPTQMRNFNQLQRFDLSSNHLVGPLPSYVFSLPALWYINLADNQLTGDLPKNTSCGKRLWFVDISRNLLVGNLPSCIGLDSSKYRKVLSLWNCLSGSKFQHPVMFCQRQALAVIPPPKKSNISSTEDEISGIRLGLIFGIIGGTILLVGTVCCIIWVICKKRKCDESFSYKCDQSVVGKLPTRPSPIIETSKYVARSMRMPNIGLPTYHSFTYEELQEATNNFDQLNLITEGSQGQVENPSGKNISPSENSEKDDIYKLGVIMLEFLTGRQVTSENEVDELKLQLESSLAESPSALQHALDLGMRGTFAYQSVKTATEITVSCLDKDPRRRPPMEDVVWHLQYSIQAQQAWTSSGNLALNSGNLGLHK